MSFRGLTPAAQKALTIWAQDAARAHGTLRLCPSHLLQAILDHYPEESDVACREVGTTRDELVTHANALLHAEKGPRPMGDVPPSREAKRIIEDSADVAQQHLHEYIGLGHLFSSCLRFVSEQRNLGWFSTRPDSGVAGPSGAMVAAFGDIPAAEGIKDTPRGPTSSGTPSDRSLAVAEAVMKLLDEVPTRAAELKPGARAVLIQRMRGLIDIVLSRYQ